MLFKKLEIFGFKSFANKTTIRFEPGVTAIVATAPGIGAKDEEVAYAVANITIFGIVAMFLYPFLGDLIFGGDITRVGLFMGTSIHETAQSAHSRRAPLDM